MGKWREERVLSDGIFTVFSGLKSRPKQMAFPRAVFNVPFWGLIFSQTVENWIQLRWVRIAVAVYYYKRLFWHSKGVCVVLAWTFHDTEKVGAGDEGMGVGSVERVARSQGFMTPYVTYSVLGCFQGETLSNESLDENAWEGWKKRWQ